MTRWSCAFCLAFICISAGAAAQDAGLKRLTLRDDLLGWEAVGRVDMGSEAFCTGTLVATDLVLTAAHCVFDPGHGYAPVDPGMLKFRAGLRDGESVADRAVVGIVVAEGYHPGPQATADNIRRDLALLRLSGPIPAASAAPFDVGALPAGGDGVAVVSYGAGRATALSIERTCAVLGHQDGLFAFDCNVTFGSSGAPVFDMSGGRGKIVSVVSAGHADGQATVSYGTDLPLAVTALRQAMAEGRGVRTSAPAAAASPPPAAAGKGTIRAGGALFVKPPGQ